MIVRSAYVGLKTKSGEQIELSYKRENIVLEGAGIYAMWDADQVGVEVVNCESHVSIGIMERGGSNNYQSFYFESGSFQLISNFFRKLRFPEHCFHDLKKPTTTLKTAGE